MLCLVDGCVEASELIYESYLLGVFACPYASLAYGFYLALFYVASYLITSKAYYRVVAA